MTWRARWIAVFAGASALLACAGAPPIATPAPAPSAPAVPSVLPPCERILEIEVRKRARELRAHCEGGAVVELQVALGRGSGGPKLRRGDDETPEGRYQISGPPRRSRFHVFIPINYPSVGDAELALAERRVSRSDYHRVIEAHAHGQPPPQDTALGGQLGLHGEGRRWRGDSRYFDWTYGCVGMADEDVEFLAARSAIGTPVSIVP
jgi:murein L,D-transpeptidase YafK